MSGACAFRCLPRWFVIPCLVALLGAAWWGHRAYVKPPAPPSQPQQVVIVLYAYDADGQPLSTGAVLHGNSEVSRQPMVAEGKRPELTKPIGTTITLRFQYGDAPPFDETITWLPRERFLSSLPDILQKRGLLDRGKWRQVIDYIERNASDVKYYYPVVFVDAHR